MHKIPLTVIFYCMLLVQVYGQESSGNAATHARDKAKKAGNASLKQKLSNDTCCKTIGQLKKEISVISTAEIKKKYKEKSVQAIIDTLNTIINRVIRREASYKIRIAETLPDDTPPLADKLNPSCKVRLRIIEGNNQYNTVTAGTLTFDSTYDTIEVINRLMDRRKNFSTSMLANNNVLLIKVSETESKLSTGYTRPAAMHSDIDKQSNSLLQNGTILLLLIAGLGCIIGLSTFLHGKSLIKKAKASGYKIPTHFRDVSLATATAIQTRKAAMSTPPESIQISSNQPAGNSPHSGTPGAIVAGSTAAVMTAVPPALKQKYFFAEIMTTSGPRKKNMNEPGADKDLGEDVCGFVADENDMLIYLLDGTSDLHCLRDSANNQEYFSSRLLAQSLAYKLRLAFTTNTKEEIDTVMLQAIKEVKDDWLTIINNLPAAEKELVRTNIENKNFPECASTLIIGQLSINGQVMVYRSGDSKLLMYSNSGDNTIKIEDTSLARKNEESNDRVFFRLVLNANKELDILYNKPNYEIVKKENIHTLVVFSDGIGAITEQTLQQQYAADPEIIRKEVMYQTQGTADDKSICFITIKQK